MRSLLDRLPGVARSLRRKMLLNITLPVLLFMAAAMGVAFSVLNDDAVDFVEASLQRQTAETARSIDTKLRELGHFAELAASLVAANTPLGEDAIYTLVSGNARVEPLIYGSAVAYVPFGFSAERRLFAPYAFKQGDAVATLDIGNITATSGYDYTEGSREWWEAPLAAGAGVWTQPYYDEGAGNIAMATYSVPFGGDAPRGVATIDISLSGFFAELGLDSGKEFVLDGDGRIIFSTDAADILKADAADADLGLGAGGVALLRDSAAAAAGGPVRVRSAAGEELWGLHGAITQTGWIYIELIPESTALQFVNAQREVMSVAVAAILLILALMIWFIAGNMAAPIRALDTAVQRVASGDYTVAFGEPSQDEIGHLTENLRNLTGLIARKNEHWEAEVHKRTEALAHTEQEVSRQKAILERALNGIDIGIVMYDSGFRVMARNAKLSEVMRFDEARVAGLDSFLEVARVFYQAKEGKPFDAEAFSQAALSPYRSARVLHFDGVAIEIKHCPMGEGNFIRTYEDVSGREAQRLTLQQKLQEQADSQKATLNMMKDAEEARKRIHESQQLIELIFNNSGNFIYAKDRDGRYLVVNNTFMTYTGLPLDKIIGHNDIEIFGEKDGAIYMETDRLVMESGKFQRRDEAIGDHYNISYKYPLTDLEGKIRGICGISTDITEQKEMQEALQRAKQEAEAATAAKANFLASMSHEIRTPMNAVIGMVDLLRQTELSEEQREMLRTIAFSGQALLTIINDILDLSKIEAGKLALEKIAFSLLETVEGSAKTVSINAQNKKLVLLTTVDPALPNQLQGDPVRIRQILINLIGNAIKFTDKGKILVRVTQVARHAKGARVRLEVKDEGIGIAPEVQSKLFSDFMQAEESTTRKYGGTGLGLSICKRLALAMGGSIGVDSTPGKGSTFYVELPLDFPPAPDTREILADLSGVHALVVSADADVSAMAQATLGARKARVTLCAQLDDCIAQCGRMAQEGAPVDVVIMGHDVPRGEQFAVARAQGNHVTRFIAMVIGRRLKARIENEDTLTLDVVPLTDSGLVQAVAIATGRASPEVHHGDAEAIEQPARLLSVEEARSAGTLVLVAEDNPINRDVIGRQLRALGHSFEMADDGRQALEAWRRSPYALLLTDCHMPVMDGFELTAAIRAEEQVAAGARRFPIVAITANALQGEAERCLAAGMDAYMSKPIDMKELRRMLKRYVPDLQAAAPLQDAAPAPQAEAAPAVEPSKAAAGAIDPAALEAMFGDDRETVRDILRDFVAPCKQIAGEVHVAAAAQSPAALKQAAHKLKSAARSIGANRLADLCYQLEQAGGQGKLDSVSVMLQEFDDSMEAVFRYIDNIK